jgi:hypothetical protein
MLAWIKLIIGGFISGLFGGAVLMIGDPRHFNLQRAEEMIWPCIAFGILGAAMLWLKSPFHKEDANEISQEALQRIKDRD